MDPFEYCRDRVAAPGSCLYYSTLWLAPEAKRGVYALLAFEDALAEIPRDCREPAVAAMKLGFWREELARLDAGLPARHPIAVLMASAGTCVWSVEELDSVLGAIGEDLVPRGYASHAALVRHFHAMCGPIWRACAGIMGYRDEATPRAIAELGTAIELGSRLQHLRADGARGRIRIPIDLLESRGVPAESLKDRDPRVRDVVALHCRRIEAELARCLAAVPARDRRAQESAVILAELCLATLAEIGRDGYRVFEHRIALTPIRKLWIAWRTHRRLSV